LEFPGLTGFANVGTYLTSVSCVVKLFSLYCSLVPPETTRKAICSHVARILREERLKQNLSMTILSERAGLSQQSVSYVEREMRIPNLDTLLRITAVLGINLSDVISRATKATKLR
jgi:ribosome-binding protein aMBF1 (putative translation factor)